MAASVLLAGPATASTVPIRSTEDVVVSAEGVDGCVTTFIDTVTPGPIGISPDDIVTYTPPATVTIHGDFLAIWAGRDAQAVVDFLVCVA